jgi:hypothetical protein
MLSGKNSAGEIDWLESILSDNRKSIFEDADDGFKLIGLSVTKPLHRREDRYHQKLKVTYATNKGVRRKDLWLKYRQDFESLFKIQELTCSRLPEGQRCFPKPYFYRQLEETSVIGMECVRGVPLRNLLLRRIAAGRGQLLNGLFNKIGRAMKSFHDSSRASGSLKVSEVAARAKEATVETDYFTQDQKKQIINHLAAAEASAGAHTELPLIKIHNDWVLRNILVTDDDSFYVVDLDSMRAPDNSRWYDVTYFLINLESQLKYWPLIDKKNINGLWKSFWSGYSGDPVTEGSSTERIMPLIYLIKVQYLLGATIRPPLYKIYRNLSGSIYLKRLRESILQGESSMFASNPSGTS